MKFIKKLVGTVFKRGKPQGEYHIPPAKEKAPVLKKPSNGQVERRIKRFGSGAGRYWPSWSWSTALADGHGWYRPAVGKTRKWAGKKINFGGAV